VLNKSPHFTLSEFVSEEPGSVPGTSRYKPAVAVGIVEKKEPGIFRYELWVAVGVVDKRDLVDGTRSLDI
jgi:hypothetical protein